MKAEDFFGIKTKEDFISYFKIPPTNNVIVLFPGCTAKAQKQEGDPTIDAFYSEFKKAQKLVADAFLYNNNCQKKYKTDKKFDLEIPNYLANVFNSQYFNYFLRTIAEEYSPEGVIYWEICYFYESILNKDNPDYLAKYSFFKKAILSTGDCILTFTTSYTPTDSALEVYNKYYERLKENKNSHVIPRVYDYRGELQRISFITKNQTAMRMKQFISEWNNNLRCTQVLKQNL